MDTVRVYSMTEMTREPKWDSAFKLLFILKGDLSFYAGTKERHLHQHDFTFIRPFELYGGGNAGQKYHVLCIDIMPDLWKFIAPNADLLRFSISILRSNNRHSAYQSICKALAQIIYYSRVSESGASARICRAVSDILAILIEDYASGSYADRATDQTTSRIQSILEYILNNYTRRFSLEEIADAIGFHPQYFSAYFKRQFGVSFTDYLNNFRVYKSIVLLRETNDSILNIALACGFNSHKTYSNAFEKYYHTSPREYRKVLKTQADTGSEDFRSDDYEYLRRFWNRSAQEEVSLSKSRVFVNIVPDSGQSAFRNRSHNIISIGRAMSCLRSDMQQQLLQARRDMDLEFVRIRDIFSDDLFVYYEDRNKTPVFSWRALDEIFDFLISADLKPFIEIGYMPSQLASKKQYAGWQYHPNVSSPKSAKLWVNLVSAFISHLLSRYGKETIEGWLFDFWTSPNLKLEQGYWNESMENFLQFYRLTYQAIKAVDPRLQFGSPNYSHPTGIVHYREFLEYARRHHLQPDFISVHLYGCGDGENNPAQRFIEYSVFDNNYRIPNIKPERHVIMAAIKELQEVISESAFSDLPIVIDDWNVTFFPTDFTRDTCFMGPYIIENYFHSCGNIFGMGFASLSDIHEDFFNTDQLFNGGPGLLTYSGIPKNGYYAMSMAYRFSRDIIQLGENYVIGRTDSGYEILIYNLDFYNDDYVGNDPSVISFTNRYNVFGDAPDIEFHIELPVVQGPYSIVRSLIGRRMGSAYDAWVRMGSPADITPEIARYLNRISTPEMTYETVSLAENVLMDEVLEPHSVLHIRISRI